MFCVLAPRISDLAHCFVPALQPIAQHAADHGQRNQHHEDQRTDSEKFDDRAVALA